MYGIQSVIYERLIQYFKNNSSIIRVTLFGSRAKGLENENSDIDLCIQVAGGLRGKAILDIEEIAGIYSCDVLFQDKINGEIKHQIDRDGIVIYSNIP